MNKKNRPTATQMWTIGGGRTLFRNGVPVFELSRYPLTQHGNYATTPAEADDLAHAIADALNARE